MKSLSKTCKDCKKNPRYQRPKGILDSYCLDCIGKRNKEWLEADPSRKAKARVRRRQALLYRYGLTEEDYDSIVASQDGKCPICLRKLSFTNVDHDHATTLVRGILCRNCNVALGLLKDNPAIAFRAAFYLAGAGIGSERIPEWRIV